MSEPTSPYFVVIRTYGGKEPEGITIAKCNKTCAMGEPVRFKINGRQCFGEVIDIIEIAADDATCKMLERLAGRNVYIHFPNAGVEKTGDG